MGKSSDKLIRVADRVRHIAGAMSGTSADGVDIAITRISGSGVEMTAQLVRHHHRPYPGELRNEIFAFRADEVRDNFLSRLAKIGREISLTYAVAVNEALAAASMSASDLDAVAAHGQTLFHGPPDTIQWFDPSLVAAEVGCPVVSDFRRADLAAGGQGAPLVPFADYILFRHPSKNRVLLNIGGIANITYLRAGGNLDEVIAFDTGPGNCISDYLCRKFDRSGLGFDAGGELARRGKVLSPVLDRFLKSPYVLGKGPKSTDGPQMIRIFEGALQSSIRRTQEGKDVERSSLSDLLATACSITVASILRSLPHGVEEVIASGGGTKNAMLTGMLREGLATVTLRSLDEFQMPSDAKEAIAFALLGAATLDGVPSNVPSVTGAKRAVVLGSITPKP